MTSRTHLLRAIALAATADERLSAAMDEDGRPGHTQDGR